MNKQSQDLRDGVFKVVKITKTEFILDNGDVYPNIFNTPENISLKDFQKILDDSKDMFVSLLESYEK